VLGNVQKKTNSDQTASFDAKSFLLHKGTK